MEAVGWNLKFGRIREMNFSLRKRRAAAAAKSAGADGLLVTHLPDVRYLCGFTGSNAALVLAGGRAVLFTDGRYTGQAKAEAVGTRVVIASKPAVWVRCGEYDGGRAGDDAEGGTGQDAEGDVCGGGSPGGEDAGGEGRGGD